MYTHSYNILVKEYFQFLNRLYDITWFGEFMLNKPRSGVWKA